MDSDYITCKTSSLNNISNIHEEASIFDSTMMSLPDSYHNNSQTFHDLNERIKILTNDLLSANQEIENLNSENFRLKADLQNSLKIIKQYI